MPTGKINDPIPGYSAIHYYVFECLVSDSSVWGGCVDVIYQN